MSIKQNIVFGLIFLSIVTVLYYLYYNQNENSYLPNKWQNVIFQKFENCKNATEDVQEIIENLSTLFNGVFYDKHFSLCVFKEKIYCLNSKVYKINNVSFVYFDQICMIQDNFSKRDAFLILYYNISREIKNINDIIKFYNNGYIFTNDKNLIKALEQSIE